MTIYQANQIALDCYRAINADVSTMGLTAKHDEMCSSYLISVIRDCIFNNPEVSEFVSRATERHSNMAKSYKNDTTK